MRRRFGLVAASARAPRVLSRNAQVPLTAGRAYQDELTKVLAKALTLESSSVRAAAEVVSRTFDAEGMLYIFGSGHSHIFAEEAFYRAGGAVRICPVLKSPYMLHEGAVRSAVLERESGQAERILAGYAIEPGRDAMLVVSNSGANALPVEVASAVRDRGAPVIAITSREYANSISRSGPRLHEVAQIVIDNHCPPGDALVELGVDLPRAGPASTIVGLTLLNSLLVEACALQRASGSQPELFLSGNVPGAAEHNQRLVAKMARYVPHL